jgi:hypothetical protein
LITESLSTLKIHTLSQQQFDREKDSGTLSANEFYLTPAPGVDETPTKDSENLATSGGIYAAIQELKIQIDETPTIEENVQAVLDALDTWTPKEGGY